MAVLDDISGGLHPFRASMPEPVAYCRSSRLAALSPRLALAGVVCMALAIYAEIASLFVASPLGGGPLVALWAVALLGVSAPFLASLRLLCSPDLVDPGRATRRGERIVRVGVVVTVLPIVLTVVLGVVTLALCVIGYTMWWPG